MPFAPGFKSAAMGTPNSFFVPPPVAPAPSVLSGTVIDANGLPVNNAYVRAYTDDTNLFAGAGYTGSFGGFSVPTPYVSNPHFLRAVDQTGAFVGTSLDNLIPFQGPALLPVPMRVSGLLMWLDASNAGSITSSSGSVSQWADLSGNGNNGAQGTGSKQPTISLAQQNGLNAIKFASAPLQVLNLAVDLNIDAAYTIICACKTGLGRIQLMGSSTVAAPFVFQFASGIVYTSNSAGYFQGPDADGGVSLISAAASGNFGLVYTDGVAQSLSFIPTGGCDATNINTIGFCNSVYTDGYILEICLYNNFLADSQRQFVEQYLKLKWATP